MNRHGERIARHESLSDAALRLARYLPFGLRRWGARRAAARGLGAAALQAAADDPMVLARLGLHAEAVNAAGGGRRGAIARAASAAAMGDIGPVTQLLSTATSLADADRTFLAASVAPFDARLARSLLPVASHLHRAACSMAAGDYLAAGESLALCESDRHAGYLRGALAAWRGEWRVARSLLNRAFEEDGLAPPLRPESDLPTTLSEFNGQATLAKVAGPLVTVVMPAHNAASTLSISLKSILSQTWRNIEVIVVDDRSSDLTVSVARSIAQEDGRVRVLSNSRSPGAYGARNTGIASATGEFISLHDADDWAHPQRLERQMLALGSTRLATVCRYFRLDAAGRPVCPRVFPFVRLSPIAVTTRSDIWRSGGLFEEVPLGADSEWLARVDNRWGRKATLRTGEVGMVALWDDGSLSSSPETGLVGEGLSRRIGYVTQWRRRHAELA